MLSLLRVVVAVGLWGGLDGFLASVTLGEDEFVDGGECVELRPQRGVGAGAVANARRVTHRTPQGVAFARRRQGDVAGLYPQVCRHGSRSATAGPEAMSRDVRRTGARLRKRLALRLLR
jgi:hypothetical protein